jgi:LysR family carnitine catabolism transcriptional activator
MNLSERQLRLFVTTAALGNISRASEALHISQPALTRAIAVFEGQMGAPLFVRTTRRVVLTPEGEAFLPTAKRLLEDLAEAGRMFSPQGLGIKGQVTVAVGSSFGSIVLPGAIAAFQAAYPGVRLRVVDDNSEGIARKVRLADVDLGIGSAVGDVDALACRRLLTAPLGLLACRRRGGRGASCATRPERRPGRETSATGAAGSA